VKNTVLEVQDTSSKDVPWMHIDKVRGSSGPAATLHSFWNCHFGTVSLRKEFPTAPDRWNDSGHASLLALNLPCKSLANNPRHAPHQ
jgi:hypothetical protein